MRIKLTDTSTAHLRNALSRTGGFISTLSLTMANPSARLLENPPRLRVRLVVDVYDQHLELVLRAEGRTHSNTMPRTDANTLLKAVSDWIAECIADQGQDRTNHAA